MSGKCVSSGLPVFSLENVEAMCRNIGLDLSCSRCASVLFTGSAVGEHAPGCKNAIKEPEPVVEAGPRLRRVSDLSRFGKQALAAYEYLPTDVVDKLIGDEDMWVVYTLTSRKRLTDEQLDRLSSHESIRVRVGIAARSSPPEWLARKLAGDDDPDVREQVACRGVPDDVWTRLVLDRALGVRRQAMRCREVRPEAVLVDVATRARDEDVLASLAYRNDLTPAVVAALRGRVRPDLEGVLDRVPAPRFVDGEWWV